MFTRNLLKSPKFDKHQRNFHSEPATNYKHLATWQAITKLITPTYTIIDNN